MTTQGVTYSYSKARPGRNQDYSLPAYASEAARRFKLNAVQHKKALAGASDDGVWEKFKSLLRTLHLMNADGCHCPMLGRNMACLVLDENAIAMLANLDFSEEDVMADYRAFRGKNYQSLGYCWVRQPTEWPQLEKVFNILVLFVCVFDI